MRLTKHEHACLVVEANGRELVIDPGKFTTPLEGIENVDAIVITHEHDDHWTPRQLDAILEGNPDARIFGPAGVAAAAAGYPVTVVDVGDTITAGEFELSFFGGRHAVIHPSVPVIDNVAVLVNGLLYYPGDSFTVPPVTVDTLAAPAGAPWMKISEVMDYVTELRPRRAFPTHEAGLSVAGKKMADARIGEFTRHGGGEYFPLEVGESIDL